MCVGSVRVDVVRSGIVVRRIRYSRLPATRSVSRTRYADEAHHAAHPGRNGPAVIARRLELPLSRRLHRDRVERFTDARFDDDIRDVPFTIDQQDDRNHEVVRQLMILRPARTGLVDRLRGNHGMRQRSSRCRDHR